MVFVPFWIACIFVATMTAKSRGLGAMAGFAGGFLFGPLGVLYACVASPKRTILRPGQARPIPPTLLRECPHCLSEIPKPARICRFCRHKSKAEEIPDPRLDYCHDGSGYAHRWVRSDIYPGYVGCTVCGAYTVPVDEKRSVDSVVAEDLEDSESSGLETAAYVRMRNLFPA